MFVVAQTTAAVISGWMTAPLDLTPGSFCRDDVTPRSGGMGGNDLPAPDANCSSVGHYGRDIPACSMNFRQSSGSHLMRCESIPLAPEPVKGWRNSSYSSESIEKNPLAVFGGLFSLKE